MFIQHEEFLINTNRINYIKINDAGLRLHIYFEGKEREGGAGYNLNLRFDSEDELSDFVERILKGI